MVKNLPAKAGDMALIPGPRRSPGEGNGNPFQYSCLGNPMDCGAWRAAVHRVTKSRTDLATKQQQKPKRKLYSVSLPLLLSVGMLSHFSHVSLFVNPWTVACQAPLSMGFSRQEDWRDLPISLLGDLPNPGIKPTSLMPPTLAGRFFTTSTTSEAPFVV